MVGSLAGQVFGLLWPVIVVVGVFVVLQAVVLSFKPRIKGWVGEKAVDLVLKTKLDASVYHRISNVTLPVDGATTQIDQVVVSRFGVFVLETKNYKGWIFGKEHDAQWTQSVFKKKSRFQNPLRQNYRHTQVLGELTGIPAEYFKSVVVFLPDAEFKTELPANVRHTHDVADYIHSFQQPIIKDEQVPEIVSAIQEWAGTVDETTKSNHVANLRKRHGR